MFELAARVPASCQEALVRERLLARDKSSQVHGGTKARETSSNQGIGGAMVHAPIPFAKPQKGILK
ncbi:hypothetical protein X566_12170 [Afipia sp. P52-10]|nr:hypothetical protein X566_12170 [Afipia sp. P52-10]